MKINALLHLGFTIVLINLFYCGNSQQSKLSSKNDSLNAPVVINNGMIIKNAIAFAKKNHISLNDRNVIFDTANVGWIKTMNQMSLDTFPELINIDYQVVRLELNKDILGGPFWVFIDKKTGNAVRYFGVK